MILRVRAAAEPDGYADWRQDHHSQLQQHLEAWQSGGCENFGGQSGGGRDFPPLRHFILKPFAFEEELKEKTERLNALNIELNLDEKDMPVLDTEPEQSEEQPERKSVSRER